MFIAGLLASLFMGAVLSFLGAGGSILTLPILVYLFKINIVEATTYSLLLVGLTALFGCIISFKDKLIDLKTGIIFGIPSILGVVLARKIILPMIPDQLIFFNFYFRKRLFNNDFICNLNVAVIYINDQRKKTNSQ